MTEESEKDLGVSIETIKSQLAELESIVEEKSDKLTGKRVLFKTDRTPIIDELGASIKESRNKEVTALLKKLSECFRRLQSSVKDELDSMKKLNKNIKKNSPKKFKGKINAIEKIMTKILKSLDGQLGDLETLNELVVKIKKASERGEPTDEITMTILSLDNAGDFVKNLIIDTEKPQIQSIREELEEVEKL